MAGRQTGGRVRAVLFLLVSFFAAGVAAAVIWSVIRDYQKELTSVTAVEETAQVVVASHDMAQGTTIEAEDLEDIELPLTYVPSAVLRDAAQAIGRVPRERILAREFIRQERLADPEAGVGLNAIIPRGMRAIAVNISGGGAVSGFLNPGNYVDVIVTVEKDQQGEREAETKTLLQAIPVLAVNARMGRGGSPDEESKVKPQVTLAVTPSQAELLTHAVAEGLVTLTLRNDIDVTNLDSHGTLASDLLGGEKNDKRIAVKEWRKAASAASSDGSIIVIRGTNEKSEAVKGP
jgi:pilus assembly protein CpaB